MTAWSGFETVASGIVLRHTTPRKRKIRMIRSKPVKSHEYKTENEKVKRKKRRGRRGGGSRIRSKVI